MIKEFLWCIYEIMFKIKVIGFEKVSFNKPVIIMPNHVSFLDPFLLYPILPKKVVFVVSLKIAKKFRFFFKYIKHVTLNPFNPFSLKMVVALIKEGYSVVIFPEGRVTTTGSLMKIYNGISFLASKTNVKVYPVIIDGPEYSKFSRITQKVSSRLFPNITIYFDNSIDLGSIVGKSVKSKREETANKILITFQNAKFKTKMRIVKSTNLFNILKKLSANFRKKIMAEDLASQITYKKAILTSFILGDKLGEILDNENRVGVLLPNSIGHVVTLFSLFYKNITPAILNFSQGTVNNIDCCKTSELKTIITSKIFIKKAKLDVMIKNFAEEFKIVYLEDINKDIKLRDKIKGLRNYLMNKDAKEDVDKVNCEARENPLGGNEVILFTSGSESKPKGVILTHRNILANIFQMLSVIDINHKDVMMNTLPMFHSFGLTAGTLLPIITGMKTFLYPSPLHYKIIPEVVYDIDATFLLGTPSFLLWYARNANAYDFYSVRYAIAGGEKLKSEVRDLWFKKFGIRIIEGYGTTEASPVLSVNTPLFYKEDSVGRLLPQIQWRIEKVEGIIDGGILYLRGPNLMKGYLLSGRGFVPCDEWYNSGDIVSIDNIGFVTIKSRLKRFAKISGEMISLDMIEVCARECFGEYGFAAISKPDFRKGEKVLLFSTKKDLIRKSFQEYLHATGQSMLLIPSEIITIEELPLLGNGKINYLELAKP